MEMDVNQRLAVETTGKNILVSASAGAGKTRVLVERLVKRCVTDRIGMDEILAVTFTEAAAAEGTMINSGVYTGMNNKDAIRKITEDLEAAGKGKKTVNYKLRDWLISRQRYWGTPIPMIYCEKCGWVPEDEKNLPVLLPTDVEFTGKGDSPLTTSATFRKCTCPVCGGEAEREIDTMDTFLDSSWYFLRYCDAHTLAE